MKDYKRLTEKKEITECEIVSDKRYSVGFKQIPHKINRNIIRDVHTICNDMDGQGDYIMGDIVDKIADLEDKIESGEIDYVSDRGKEIARLTAENERLREEAAEQKSIAEHEHASQMEWFRIACDYKAELAALQKRIEKSVELPCVKMVKTKEWIDRVEIGDTILEWAVVYIDRQGEFVVEPCASRYAAEARLTELKGE